MFPINRETCRTIPSGGAFTQFGPGVDNRLRPVTWLRGILCLIRIQQQICLVLLEYPTNMIVAPIPHCRATQIARLFFRPTRSRSEHCNVDVWGSYTQSRQHF